MLRHPDTCSPCGLRRRPVDHAGDMLALLEHEDEPLILLTQLLRWCRTDHRILWEHAQQYPEANPVRRPLHIAWPTVGTHQLVDPGVRRSVAALASYAGNDTTAPAAGSDSATVRPLST